MASKRTNRRKYQKSRSTRTYKSKGGYRKKSKSGKRKSAKRKTYKRKTKGNKKQKGGFKTCSLGYAMVKGMEVPAINNVEGNIQFNDVYARLNSGTCNSAVNGGNNHPVLKTH